MSTLPNCRLDECAVFDVLFFFLKLKTICSESKLQSNSKESLISKKNVFPLIENILVNNDRPAILFFRTEKSQFRLNDYVLNSFFAHRWAIPSNQSEMKVNQLAKFSLFVSVNINFVIILKSLFLQMSEFLRPIDWIQSPRNL